MKRFYAVVAAAFVLTAHSSHAGDPAVTCETGKLKTAGKYASCLLSADAKAAKTGDPADYTKCLSTIDTKWAKAESAGLGMCPNGTGDQAAIESFLDACSQSVTSALANDADLPLDVVTCNADLGTCDGNLTTCGGSLSTCNAALATCEAQPVGQPTKTGQTSCYTNAGAVMPCGGTGQDGELQNGVARSFTDNGDGTITDNATGLMWEKLSDDGSIHDKDDQYTWANARAVKVAGLNAAAFAGHDDWRVPNVSELQTLVNWGTFNPTTYATFNTACAANCTPLTCSCTATASYWSSSTVVNSPTNAWPVNFSDGHVGSDAKGNGNRVRAVRTAAVSPPPLL